MNKDLQTAFTSVENARKALDELQTEKQFHSETWKQAFYHVFERLESLKPAPPRDAATLGLIYCKQISNLINDLIEVPANQFSVADLCTLTSYGRQDLIDKAESAFEDVLQDLYEGTIYEDGTLVGMVSHKVRFNNEEDLQAALQQLVEDWEFANVRQAENALSLLFESDRLLDKRTQEAVLKSMHCVNSQFNIRPLSKVYYTVKMDRHRPYALILSSDESKKAEEYTGYENLRELQENMCDTFGPDVVRLSAAQFQAELEKRLVHTPEIVELLKRDSDLLGQDLSKCFVYGSFNRPMSSAWARIDGAVYIQSDKSRTGYHTYVAVPGRLDNETISRYELEFVSRPAAEGKAS